MVVGLGALGRVVVVVTPPAPEPDVVVVVPPDLGPVVVVVPADLGPVVVVVAVPEEFAFTVV